MVAATTTLLHGLLLCLPFSVFAIVSFRYWPRLWLHSLPPDIAQMAGPKTAEEVRQTRYLLIPVLLILPGLSTLSLWYVKHPNITFFGALVHLYGVWIIVHLWDFAVIDCGHALLIDAQHPPIPGTEGATGYRDYGFHFRAFLHAVWRSALFVVPCALLVSLFG